MEIVFEDRKNGWIKKGDKFLEDSEIIIQYLYFKDFEYIELKDVEKDLQKKEYESRKKEEKRKIDVLKIKTKNKEDVEKLKKIREELIKKCIKEKLINEEDTELYKMNKNMIVKGQSCTLQIEKENISEELIKNKNIKINIEEIKIDRIKKTMNINFELV